MKKIEIIAEIGINHSGDMNLAKRMIKLAKLYGADVAKFQLYNPLKLLNREDFSKDDWQSILYSKLSFEQTAMLKEICDKEKIEFFASAFDLERLEWLEKLNVKRHKIASRSIYDKEYVEAIKKINKPYLVSMGMIDYKKEDTYETWERVGMRLENCSILFCISKYPTELKDIKFDNETFIGYDGFSDHTIGTTASLVAITYGAKIIEKHFTLDKTMKGPDQAGSMTPIELLQLSKFRDDLIEMDS